MILSDEDYRYGVGPILARVVRVVGRVEYHGEPWYSVEAEVANGTPENHGAWHAREIYIRESTFLQNRRPIV